VGHKNIRYSHEIYLLPDNCFEHAILSNLKILLLLCLSVKIQNYLRRKKNILYFLVIISTIFENSLRKQYNDILIILLIFIKNKIKPL